MTADLVRRRWFGDRVGHGLHGGAGSGRRAWSHRLRGGFTSTYSALSMLAETHTVVGAHRRLLRGHLPVAHPNSTPRQQRTTLVPAEHLDRWCSAPSSGTRFGPSSARSPAPCSALAIRELNRRTSATTPSGSARTRPSAGSPAGSSHHRHKSGGSAHQLEVEPSISEVIWALLAVALITWVAAHLCMTERAESPSPWVSAPVWWESWCLVVRRTQLRLGGAARRLLRVRLAAGDREQAVPNQDAEHRAERGLATEFDCCLRCDVPAGSPSCCCWSCWPAPVASS